MLGNAVPKRPGDGDRRVLPGGCQVGIMPSTHHALEVMRRLRVCDHIDRSHLSVNLLSPRAADQSRIAPRTAVLQTYLCNPKRHAIATTAARPGRRSASMLDKTADWDGSDVPGGR
jgi:hypothetical protein